MWRPLASRNEVEGRHTVCFNSLLNGLELHGTFGDTAYVAFKTLG